MAEDSELTSGAAAGEGAPTETRRRLLRLTRHECRLLLESKSVGRLGVLTGTRPQIFPVNYRVFEDGVVFRVGVDGVLGGLRRPQPVAFEIDEIDEVERVGWSVLLQGTTRSVHEPEEQDRALALLQIPWAVGLRPHVIHVRSVQLTGRRVLRVPAGAPVRS